jgi:hypothetical protein
MLTNITRRSADQRPIGPSRALLSVVSAALHQQTQQDPTKPCPRRAGRPPGWPATNTAAAEPRWAGWGIPSTSLRATTRCPGGKPDTLNRRRLRAHVAPAAARGRAAPGRRDAHYSQRSRSSVSSFGPLYGGRATSSWELEQHRSPAKIRPSPGRQALGRREKS